ncbi:Cobyrinate a,c-diamide synthase [Nymphon striatum]|nr:Cobyrinate a,c-diamide synthase [Nymphon striatum]
MLLGYQTFDKDINIAGVIFNLAGGARHEDKLRNVTEEYTDIPVLGVVPKSSKLDLDERHLGLMPSNERMGAEQKINEIAEVVALTWDKQALEAAGAELVSINTLEDTELPEVDGLFIGGGFPETHMQQLANNASMRVSINQAIEDGLPTYAECGGLMYLSQNLRWNEQTAPMVGIIPADAVMHRKPQGRGHVKLVETEDMPWPTSGEVKGSARKESEVINGHEFHYSRLETSCLEKNSEDLTKRGKFAYRVTRGTGITGEYDGWVYKNLLASYAHMRDTENYHWASRFVEFVQQMGSDKLPLRIAIKVMPDGSFHYNMGFDDNSHTGDKTFDEKDIHFVVDAASIPLIGGMTMDYVDIEGTMEIVFLNPNDPNYKPPQVD